RVFSRALEFRAERLCVSQWQLSRRPAGNRACVGLRAGSLGRGQLLSTRRLAAPSFQLLRGLPNGGAGESLGLAERLRALIALFAKPREAAASKSRDERTRHLSFHPPHHCSKHAPVAAMSR